MDPLNFNERKRQIIKFAVLYGGSLALLLVIFLAFRDTSLVAENPETPNFILRKENQQAIMADSMLHQQLMAIQVMDKQYALLLGDSSADRRSDSVDRAIKAGERKMRNMLDSLGKANGTDSFDIGSSNLRAFWAELDDRKTQVDIRNRIYEKNRILYSDPQAADLENKGALIDKDIRIADLESKVNNANQYNRSDPSSETGNGKKTDEAVLRKAFDDLQKDYDRLTDINTRLRNSNDLLNTQISGNGTPGKEVSNSSGKTRISMLERRVEDLNSALYLSTVDCNLSRVDVNQIISNARQRRELLKQAMEILNSLKNSSNPEVVKIAQEKTAQLNRIAATVRD